MIDIIAMNEALKQYYIPRILDTGVFDAKWKFYPKYFKYGKLNTKHKRSRRLRRAYREYLK